MARRGVIDPAGIKTILICVFGGMADCLRIAPYVRAARQKFPEARISLLTDTRGRELFARCPYADEVTLLPPVGSSLSRLDTLRRLGSGLGTVRGKFDLFIGSPFFPRRTALMSLFSGARYRIGYRAKGVPFAWTVDLGPVDYAQSLQQRFDRLWQGLGIDQVNPRLETWPSPEDEAHVEKFLEAKQVHPEDLLIGLHAGSDWGCQQWHPRSWAALGNELQSRYGARLIVTGTTDDQADYDAVARLMPVPPISAVGHTTLGQLASLIHRFRALITIDSGLVPLGVAANVPTIVLSFQNPSPWAEPRWPHLVELHPPAWFRWPAINQVCRIRKQRQRISSCKLSVCIGTQGARLISVKDVLSNLEPLLTQKVSATPVSLSTVAGER